MSDFARAVYLAEHLFQMVPREVWRDHGGDDGQGHYEGDYHAEQVAEELRGLRALADSYGCKRPEAEGGGRLMPWLSALTVQEHGPLPERLADPYGCKRP